MKLTISGFMLGYSALFLGSTLLLTQYNIPIVISIIFNLVGHGLIIIFGKNKVGVANIIVLDFILGIVLIIYYFTCNSFKIGIVHNIIIAITLYCHLKYVQYQSKKYNKRK